jgi:hypothetical protein
VLKCLSETCTWVHTQTIHHAGECCDY